MDHVVVENNNASHHRNGTIYKTVGIDGYHSIIQSTTISQINSSLLNDSNHSLHGNETEEGTCETWIITQHTLYQIGSLCLALAFLVPSRFKYNVILVRGCVSLGSLLIVLWGGMYMCMWDVMSWNLAFFIINVFQLIYHGRHEYPVKIDPELENLYQFFKPFKLPKKMFKEMVSSARITTLCKGAIYAEEYQSPCNQKLSILLSGRMKVHCESLFLHYIEVNQYVDSPEYEAYQPDQEEQGEYQVTITAVEDCRLLTWNPHDFCAYLKSQLFAKALMTNLIGKDITVKLYQIQELLRHPITDADDERKRSSSDNMSPLLQPRPPPSFRNSISIPNIPPANSYHQTKHRFSINDIAGHTYKPCKQPWDSWDYTTSERVKDKCDHLKPSNYHSAFREDKPSYFNVYYKQACRDSDV